MQTNQTMAIKQQHKTKQDKAQTSNGRQISCKSILNTHTLNEYVFKYAPIRDL